VAYSADSLRLRKPTVVELPRLDDRISYLYLDTMRIQQDETGVIGTDADDVASVQIPAAGLSVLLLGPGTSMTAPAATTLYRSGTCVIFCGLQGAVAYAAARPLTGWAKWAEAQARLWASDDARRTAALRLYTLRYPSLSWAEGASIATMRGIEGQQVKRAYAEHARRARLGRWRRETNSELADDPVNPLLNLANSILYGAALAAVSALALNPALGIIHQGAAGALLFDLADMHKHKSSIPAAFKFASHHNSAQEVRTAMRDYLVRENVLKASLELLTDILGPHLRPDVGDRLIADHPSGAVPGGRNYA
jgi:CRISP-associated protein Cas1